MDEVDGFWAGAQDHGGRVDLPALAAAAGGWEALRRGGREALEALGVPPERAARWTATPPRRTRGTALTLADPRYPPSLRQMRSPPPVVCVEGAVEALHGVGLGVVGTRACTAYGRGVARHLGLAAARAGLVVVSGLARGVDGEAHRGALEAGRTVAVVAHGLDHTAPPMHGRLRAELVARGGAVVSAFPDALEPRPFLFPQRNAWIAGLSACVVVVEAGVRSGALITARHALEEGREVAAVPGPLGAPQSAGCLGLLRDGATPVTGVDELVARLTGTVRTSEAWLDELFAGRALDDVARRHGRSAAELLAALTRLEVEGRVVALPGRRYAPAERS